MILLINMLGQTIKIIINKVFNKSVPKPINLHPRYDLGYVINYQGKCSYYDYNQIVKMNKIEKILEKLVKIWQ